MKLLQSISHPELLVSECGQVYKENKKLTVNTVHALSIRGPIITYKYHGKGKYISIMRIVYEAYINGKKLEINEHVEPLDGDEMNVHAKNLTIVSKKPRNSRFKNHRNASLETETHHPWANGIDEIYC